MRAARRRPDDLERGVRRSRVHHDVRAGLFGEGELAGGDVESRHAQPHRSGVLNREMAETPDA